LGLFFYQTGEPVRPSRLILSDKRQFRGQSPSWQAGTFTGEVVFNTGMVGYVESLTDPSYAGEILVFTYPLIGNYGVAGKRHWESDKIQAAGAVFSEACEKWSHSAGLRSLLQWLKDENVPVITGIDTRALTRHLRSRGTMMGAITTASSLKLGRLPFPKIKVSVAKPLIYHAKAAKKVILVDCGAKKNILRSLLKLPISVKRVPYDYDYSKEDYDGVVISNGPGDPVDYPKTILAARKVLAAGKPVFGICLGSQIMALAAGAQTYRLPYGHRGHNQPCISGTDGRCYITSQNHGYAIKEDTLPKGWQVSFRNLNDGTVEGLEHRSKPFFSVQFHPEASPGPTDSYWLFEKFYSYL